MRSLSSRTGLVVIGALGLGIATPLACFPSYIYDLPGTGGTTSSGSSSGTMASSSTSTGMSSSGTGGMTTTTKPACAARDCSDPSCDDTFVCVPPVPTADGWVGYFELYNDTASSPGCINAEWPSSKFKGNDSFVPGTATCDCAPCSVSGQSCRITGMADPSDAGTIDPVVGWDGTCASGFMRCGSPIPAPPTWNGTCDDPGGVFPPKSVCGPGSNCNSGSGQACNQSLRASPLQVVGGTCGTAPAPTLTRANPAWTWGRNAEACGDSSPGVGCQAADHTCLPRPQGAFVKGVCIMQSGEQTCPAGFTDTHVIYDPAKTVDNRACGACTCGAITNGTCSATITVYSDTSCSSSVTMLHPTTQAGDCQDTPGNPAYGALKATFSAVSGGSCAAGGGQLTGAASPGGATTFCCVP